MSTGDGTWDAVSDKRDGDKKDFGDAVRARRVALGMTQEQVFSAGGPSVATLRNIENGTADCRPRTVRRLMEVLQSASSARETATPLGKAFGAGIRSLREGRGWSQEQLAKRLQVFGVALHQTSISKIEKGTRPVTIDEAAALAMALDVSLGLLLPQQAEGWRTLAVSASATASTCLPGAVGESVEELLRNYALTATHEDERVSALARAVVQQAGGAE